MSTKLETINEDVPMENQKKKKVRSPSPVYLALQKIFLESGSLRTFMINFLLVYNVRFGIALLGRIFTLARTSPKSLLDLGEILSEKHLIFREEAVRMGMFVATLSGIYIALKRFLLGGLTAGSQASVSAEWYHPLVSGIVSGLSLYWMDKSWHRTLALYSATRAAQCFYNFSKARGYFHFWGSSWSHGDSLLFGISSAQIMYSYVMRPQALPPSYYAFIRKQGPLPEVVLQAVRDSCRGRPINTQGLFEYVKEKGGKEALDTVMKAFPNGTNICPKIPVRALHASTRYAVVSAGYAWWNVAKQIFGVYLSLALVPQVVLHFQKFIKNPLDTVWKSLASAIQSTAFLSTFCGGYQFFVVCIQRPLLDLLNWSDHKFWYYIAGCFASFSILIERKSRRSELALYAFPRAADAMYQVLYDRQLVFSIPQGEVLLFCLSMGFLTMFYENDRASLSPFVINVFGRFLPEQILNPSKKPLKSPSSYELGELRSDSPQVDDFSPQQQHQQNQMISFGGSTLVS